MFAMDFEFNGEKLSDYGMIICSIDGSLDGTFSSGSDITFTQLGNAIGRHVNIYGSYDTPFQTTFCICKDIYNTGDNENMSLSPVLISAIQRWLCIRNGYKKFKLLGDDNYADFYWNATFTAQQIVYGGNIIGLNLTMYTDSPYAYRDEIVNIFNDVFYFTIIDLSDEIGYIQPDLEIKLKSNGNLSIKNSLNSKITVIKDCTQFETIKIDGTKEIISTDNSAHKLTLARDFNYFFPRIINTYSERENLFQLNIKCDITVTYSPIIKVGI